MKTSTPVPLTGKLQNLFQIAVMLAAFNFLSAPAFGQNQWTRQSPLPAPRNLTGVAWATPTHGFVSGEARTFIETLDGGATWQSVNIGASTSDPFYNAYCLDATTCFVIGTSGSGGPDHWRTTDGGASWQRITNFPVGGSWYNIDFVSASVGFMSGNGVARTTDGGATWPLMSGYPDCPVMYGMDFRDTQVGLAGGNRVSVTDGGPGIFKTTDAGVTWVRKFSQSANDVIWLNNTTAIATVGTSIYQSVDAGETWSAISNQISTGLGDMSLLPNGTIVGVSDAGDAWRSADGGVNWTRTLVGLGDLPASWNISFFDNEIGTIVGQGGFIFKTTDGGLTWAMLNCGIGGVTFYDLEMFDDNAGLAVGDNGYILRTVNGGNRWDTARLQVSGVVVGRNESLQAVSVVDANFAVAAGYDGVVYKTFDRGATWQSIGYPNLPGQFFISDVKFIDRNLGYVTGSRPGIAQGLYRTTDGGATWTALTDPNGGYSLDFVDANHGWDVFVGGLGYRTTDGGATWQQMTLPNQGFSPSISKIDFINTNVGWAVGWHGYAAHTTDGGITWQLQNIATIDDQILGLYVLSTTEVFAVGAPSGGSPSLYHTGNAGATWQKFPVPNQYSVSSIFATQSRKVWTSGYDGAVLHDPNFGGPISTPTPTPTPTATPISTPTPTPTLTPPGTPTSTPTPSPTATPEATPTPTPAGSPTPTPAGSPTPTPAPVPASKAINLSTRMRVQTGDNVGIGGFIITGSAPKHVLLRVIGPSLTGFGVPDALANPVLELHGTGGFATITNDNWRQSQEAEIQATGIPPNNDFEAAIMATLPAGAYTAIVRGSGNTSGVALVEVYDLNQAVDSKLANLSTRAFVSTDSNIAIAGFMLGGNSGSDRVVVRGIGPSLTAAGVPNALADPTLELRDTNGALRASNNDWRDNPVSAAELTAAGLAPSNNLESAIAATLPPGLYTALLSGAGNSTGIGVVEVYDRGAMP
jgi:photosystem II stability/assembly factor-like uncharacterized protein